MRATLTFDYSYGIGAEQFSHYRIPRVLIIGAELKGLSTDAKLLYCLKLDRMGFSAKSGWFDEGGRVYVYYRQDDMQNALDCSSESTVTMQIQNVRGYLLAALFHAPTTVNQYYRTQKSIHDRQAPSSLRLTSPVTVYDSDCLQRTVFSAQTAGVAQSNINLMFSALVDGRADVGAQAAHGTQSPDNLYPLLLFVFFIPFPL